jgi:HSP20 family molecular chaperone IbpA
MIKHRRIKGIHDIATTVPKVRGIDSIKRDVGGIDLGGIRSTGRFNEKVTEACPRTWVFSTRPTFIRHQKLIERSLLVEKVEEPVVNVFEEIKELIVLAEMPGADQESISCKIKDDILSISAEAKDSWGTKKYEKEILLPFTVSPASLKTSYKNQILEIKLKRREKEVDKNGKSPNSGSKDKKRR